MNLITNRICIAMTATALFAEDLSAQEEITGQVMDTDRTDWWGGDGITGDWFGARTMLSDHGIDLFGSYTIDVFGNTTGGVKTGTIYAGLLQFGAELDLDKLVGWQGGSVSTTWLWISGKDASEELVGNFLTISNIAGLETLRMFELWFQQNLFDDVLSLRAGQLAADSEFIISDYAGLFINGTFGWPAFTYMNIPAGGPGYPMGTLGLRLALQPVHWFTFMTAVFQGDVFEQDVNRHGFRYRLDAATGYTFINEAQIRWNHADEEIGLPGALKSGIWFQTGNFADPLADSTRSGNLGAYWILDQMLYREPTRSAKASVFGKGGADCKNPKQAAPTAATEKTDQGLGFFTRIAFTPQDRNFVNFYFDTGLTYKGLIPGRDVDTLGIGFGYAQISNGSRSALRNNGSVPRGAEMVLEATYQIQINNWFAVQPDLQVIINPNATSDFGNALLLGFRGEVTF
jgi:porin